MTPIGTEDRVAETETVETPQPMNQQKPSSQNKGPNDRDGNLAKKAESPTNEEKDSETTENIEATDKEYEVERSILLWF